MNAQLKRELKPLRKAVRGRYPEIASRCGLTVGAVCRVLNGDWWNEKVIRCAKDIRNGLAAEKANDILKKLKYLNGK